MMSRYGVGRRSREGEGVAVSDPGRRDRACHDPSAGERERESAPDAPGRALLEEDSAADYRQNRGDIADESCIRDLGAVDRDMERANVDCEGEAGEDQRNGGAAKVGRRRMSAPGDSRPDCQRRHGESHAPSRARKRADIQKAHQNAGPRDDGSSGEKRDHTDPVRRGRPVRRRRLDFGVHGLCAIRFAAAGARLRAVRGRALFEEKRH
jgi:hypothetical protein